MKSFDLKPTKKILIEMLEKNSLGRNKTIYRFIRLLLSIEDATTISLDGDWGSGKTFFVKQVKLVLEAYNSSFKISENNNESDQNDDGDENINRDDIKQIKEVMSNINKYFFDETLVNNPQIVVYYDAWENDDEVDPILSLIFRIVESINENFDIKIEIPDSIKKLLEKFTEIMGLKSISLIFSFIKDCKSMVKFNSKLKNQKQNNDLKQEIKVFLNSLLKERGNKLIILIDELDRCSPSYAVKMLERIKHYFDDDNIIFVFSTDLSQLTHTIKKFYGEGYDSCRYLNRFFDLRLKLPEASLEKYCNKNIRFYINDNVIDTICSMIIKEYNLSLRQINKLYRLIKISLFRKIHHYNYSMITDIVKIFENKNSSVYMQRHEIFCIIFIIPLAIALSIIDNESYYNFIRGKNSSPLTNLINLYKDKINKDIYWLFSEESFIEENNNTTFGIPQKVQTPMLFILDNKVKEMYEAIFVKNYTKASNIMRVGNLEINLKIKKSIHDSLNLLSDLSYFEEQEENILN